MRAGDSGREVKHRIRGAFHQQLQQIWRRHNVLSRINTNLGRPTRPGSILFGPGHRQLKILLDSLRMPQVEQELPIGGNAAPEMFCLLADDNLVTRLSISSYQLLAGYSSDDEVDVDIDVTIRALTPMAGTWALLF
jgi:hypothetical protein